MFLMLILKKKKKEVYRHSDLNESLTSLQFSDALKPLEETE